MNFQNSDIAICATALMELGSRPINDFNEDNDAARLCSNFYSIVRDEMLREHPWNFAKKRMQLPADKEKPAFGYKNQFTLPTDFIRLMEVNGAAMIGGQALPQGYEIENGTIVCNADVLNIRYIYRNDDPTTWDASFVRLMITGMKRALAYPLTRDPQAYGAAFQEWGLALKAAKTANGIELPPREIDGNGSAWMEARY